MSDLGLIYTSGSLPSYRAALAALGATWAKIVPAWWPHGPTPLAPRTLVRSSWGDPSYDNGRRAYPVPEQVLEELRPYAALPGLAVEIGNEPNVSGLDPRRYGEALSAAVAACRAAFGTATPIVAGSLSMNQAHRADAAVWLVAMGPALRACDGVAIHAYTLEEADAARRLVRQHVSGTLPLWMTECNVNAPLSPAARAVAVREMAEGCAVATLYHWCEQPGDDPTHFNPYYTLTLADLAALRGEAERPVLGANVPGFAMDVRRWRTVAEFRAHLARHDYRATAPWARGVVIHHTYRPTAAEWRGAESMASLARYYRGLGWLSGPHLFVCPDAPREADRGIWQLTPLNLPGTHARAANPTTWGIEHVGDYTSRSMPPDVAAMGAGAAAALLGWAGLPVSAATVTPHAQWGKPECPGKAVDMDAYRRAVAALR